MWLACALGVNCPNMPPDIPDHLKNKAISLAEIGVNSVAWKVTDALAYIDYIEHIGKFVLGGDVLVSIKDSYEHNYDNWCFEFKDGNAAASAQRARDYIFSYPEGNYVFNIVVA
jgi:hypothetical protein